MIENLTVSVQRNCDIADARYGTDFTMCVYLMKMREYFRWHEGYALTDKLPKEELGDWLVSREDYWGELEQQDFEPIRLADEEWNPFDAEAINLFLREHGLVYSAGLENCAKPHFYLAKLESEEQPLNDGFSIRISGQELARGLNSPPAMTCGHTIFLRREALKRLLWERLETWRWNSPDNAMGRAFACYDLNSDIDAALSQMADTEIDCVRQHEIGEYIAGQLLPDNWNDMLIDIAHTQAELLARAVRDLLSDCMKTIPYIIDNKKENSLHFYVGNLTGMRQEIFPLAQQIYQQWLQNGDYTPFTNMATQGVKHWADVAGEMCDIYKDDEKNAAVRIKEMMQTRFL